MNITDIPETLADLQFWSKASIRYSLSRVTKSVMIIPQEYEEVHIVPAESNFLVASYTIMHITRSLPDAFGVRRFMEQVAHGMLEGRTREAMLYVTNLVDVTNGM